MAMPEPVQDVNLYGMPAAPQPVLDLGAPPRTLAVPARPRQPAKANAKRAEKAKRLQRRTRPQRRRPSR
jgi:hypothetical protein